MQTKKRKLPSWTPEIPIRLERKPKRAACDTKHITVAPELVRPIPSRKIKQKSLDGHYTGKRFRPNKLGIAQSIFHAVLQFAFCLQQVI
ncbi:MAG: hypothetical protein WDN00_04920 [Limisphaerales bacterium]